MINNNNEKHMKEIKEKYLESIFLKRNLVTKKMYDLNAKTYFSNYGKFIPKNKNIKILDIGCGMGHFLYALTKKGYKNFIGIDISSQMIDFCKGYKKRTGLKKTFEEISNKVKQTDAFVFLKNNKNKFDLIVANDFIEHIKKDKIVNIFRLVHKNLNTNGIFIVKTVNMANLVSNMLLYDDLTHEVGFTIRSLSQLYILGDFKQIYVDQFIARKPRLITKIFRKFTLRYLSEIFGVKPIKNWSPLIFGVGKKIK